jgi:predicted GNAT family acetyltransferase
VIGIHEVGIITREEHRQKGYATITCAHLIRECEQQSFETLWNCAKQNVGSNALARKLGYRKAEEYRVIAWFKSS